MPSEIPRNANRFSAQRYYGFFLQDDWRAAKRLTINLGLRWDYQRPFIERFNRQTSVFDPTILNPISDAAQAAYAQILNQVLADPVRYPFGPQLAQLVPASAFKIYGVQRFAGIDGQPRTVTGGDFHEWQPRVGFAYQINQRTVVRGGFGRFTASSAVKGGQNGFSATTPIVSSADSGLTPYDTLSNPFRNGIQEPTGSALGPFTNLGLGVSWVNQNPKIPFSWEASLHIQREHKGWLFEAGYTHNKTANIASNLQQNDIGFDNWKTFRTPRFDATGKPLARPYLTDEQISESVFPIARCCRQPRDESIDQYLRPAAAHQNSGWTKQERESVGQNAVRLAASESATASLARLQRACVVYAVETFRRYVVLGSGNFRAHRRT